MVAYNQWVWDQAELRGLVLHVLTSQNKKKYMHVLIDD